MKWPFRRNREPGAKRPSTMLAWALSLGLLFGLVAAGEYPEDRLRAVRNHLNERPVSGQIVLVGVDEKSVREIGRWPWPRSRYAQLIEALDKAEPQQQVHDILLSERTDPALDRQLARAMSHGSNITLAYLPRAGAQEGKFEDVRPLPEFLKHAGIGTIGLQYNYANEAWYIPRGTRRGDTVRAHHQPVARRETQSAGVVVAETAYGWPDLRTLV